jgi:hypothetical protein
MTSLKEEKRYSLKGREKERKEKSNVLKGRRKGKEIKEKKK